MKYTTDTMPDFGYYIVHATNEIYKWYSTQWPCPDLPETEEPEYLPDELFEVD